MKRRSFVKGLLGLAAAPVVAKAMPEANDIIKEAVLANQKPENLFGRLES